MFRLHFSVIQLSICLLYLIFKGKCGRPQNFKNCQIEENLLKKSSIIDDNVWHVHISSKKTTITTEVIAFYFCPVFGSPCTISPCISPSILNIVILFLGVTIIISSYTYVVHIIYIISPEIYPINFSRI